MSRQQCNQAIFVGLVRNKRGTIGHESLTGLAGGEHCVIFGKVRLAVVDEHGRGRELFPTPSLATCYFAGWLDSMEIVTFAASIVVGLIEVAGVGEGASVLAGTTSVGRTVLASG